MKKGGKSLNKNNEGSEGVLAAGQIGVVARSWGGQVGGEKSGLVIRGDDWKGKRAGVI